MLQAPSSTQTKPLVTALPSHSNPEADLQDVGNAAGGQESEAANLRPIGDNASNLGKLDLGAYHA